MMNHKNLLTMTLLVGGLTACSQGYQFNLPEESNNYDQSVLYNNKIDILFMVDNSSSMALYQNNLADQIPALVNSLSAQRLDIHFGVVSSSMGGTTPNGGKLLGSPTFVTSGTPGVAQILSDRIRLGQTGSDLERGLDSIVSVLSPSSLTGQAAGFLRDDALLAIVALTNEDDKSSTLGSVMTSYANYLDQIKGFYDNGDRRWSMNFVGVPSLGASCISNDATGFKEPGVRWMQLADLSNGVKESICEGTLVTAVSKLRTRIAQILTDYKLSKKPNIATIRVFVGNVEIPRSNVNGWDYIEAKNVVRFFGSAVPAADIPIRIDFTPAEAN